MTNLKKWKESDIKTLSPKELKSRFGIDETNPGVLLEDEMKFICEEISKWSPEQKKSAREHLMKTFEDWRIESERKLLWMRTPNGWRN